MADQSNEMGMVERVARAICAKDWLNDEAWAAISEITRERFRRQARAAIEAMRTPTEAMINAGGCFEVPQDDYNEDVGGYAAEGAYILMIDAALSHDEVEGQPDDVMTRFCRGETITLADLTRDDENE
jgi:hypothetical protein